MSTKNIIENSYSYKKIMDYKNFVDACEHKKKYEGSISLEEEKKLKLCKQFIEYFRRVAIKDYVVQYVNGFNVENEIREYLDYKIKPINDALYKAEKEKREKESSIKNLPMNDSVYSGYLKELNNINKRIDELKRKKEYIEKNTVTKDGLISMVISFDKEPNYILSELMREVYELVPFDVGTALLEGKFVDAGEIADSLFDLQYFNNNGSINRDLVDLSLSALGEGNLLEVLSKAKEYKNAANKISNAFRDIRELPLDLQLMAHYNEQLSEEDDKIFDAKLKEPNSAFDLLNFKKNKQNTERRQNAVRNSCDLKENKKKLYDKIRGRIYRINETSGILGSKMNELCGYIYSFNKEYLLDLDSTSAKWIGATIDRHFADVSDLFKNKINELNDKGDKLLYGVSSSKRDLDYNCVKGLAYAKKSADTQTLQSFRLVLKVLQDVDELSKRKINPIELLSYDEAKLIRDKVDDNLSTITIDDKYSSGRAYSSRYFEDDYWGKSL